MKSSLHSFNLKSGGFDYTKQRGVIEQHPVHSSSSLTESSSSYETKTNHNPNEMVYVKRPIKKINSRFQKD